MRKLIVAGIVFVLLGGGFIVYMEIDKRKFIDNISLVAPVVDQPANVLETTRDAIQENKKPKFQEVDPNELLAAVNRIPEQFGYSEASTIYAKLETKRMSGEKLTIDENVARLEAMLYLYPDEDTRRSLILRKFEQSKGPDFHPRDGFSEEDIAKLRELGIPVVWRGNKMIINPMPDHIREEVDREIREEYPHMFNDPHSFPPRPSRSEGTPIMPEPKTSVTSEHVHQEDRHVHPRPAIQPPAPPPVEGIKASGWEGLSAEQREQAKQLFDQYGTEEGLRRLREIAPDAAERFEFDPDSIEDAENRHKSIPPSREQAGRERRSAPSRDASNKGQSESESKD